MRTEDLLYYNSDEFKENLKRYEQMFEQRKGVYMDASELIDIAEYYTINGSPEQVADCVAYALKLHPRAVDPLAFKARQQMLAGNLKEARRLCDYIEDQQDEEVFYLNAELMIYDKQVEEASTYLLQKLLQGLVDSTSYAYEVAELFADHQCFEVAYEWIQRSLAQNHTDIEALELKCSILVGLRRFDELIEFLEKKTEEYPYEEGAWIALAEGYLLKEEYNKAIDACEYALAIDAEAYEAMLIRANCFHSLGNFAKAQQLYQELESHNPLDLSYYVMYGSALTNLERYDEALEQFETAELLADSPDEKVQIFTQKTQPLSKLNRVEEALDYIDRAISYEKENSSLYVIKGHVLLESGQDEKAQHEFSTALRMSDGSLNTQFQIAISYFDNKLYSNTCQILKHIEENDDTQKWNKRVYPYLAACYLYMNEVLDFLCYLKVACEMNPEETQDIFEHIFPNVHPSEYYSYAITKYK